MSNSNLRRMMMAQKHSAPSEDWDIDWKYTDGPLENFGFIVSGHTEMKSDGLYLFSDTLTRIACPIYTCTKGIVEADIFAVKLPQPSASGANGFRLLLSNGQSGCQMRLGGYRNYDEIRFGYDNIGSYKPIYDAPVEGANYSIRLEYGTENAITINGSEAIRTTARSTDYATGNKIFQQQAGETVLKALRYKFIER